jgi:hypothetical protein
VARTFAKPCGLCKKLCQVSRKWWKGQRRSFYQSAMWSLRHGAIVTYPDGTFEDGTLMRLFKWNRPCVLCGCDRDEVCA